MITEIASYRASLVAAFEDRKIYEASKNASNENIQKTLNDLLKSVDHDAIAEVMMNASVNAEFINRSERSTARFNVYSAEKVVNIARAAKSVAALNHYTRAILLTAKTFAANDMKLTHKDAVSACSLSCKSDAKREKLITKYQKHVAANTAATQSSSSINALQMFDVLRETRDESNNVSYVLNAESEVAAKLLALVA